MKIIGARVLVVGMAKSGIAVAHLLQSQGAEVIACDEKPASQLPELPVPLVPQTPEAFRAKDLIVISPGVPADLPVLEDVRRRGIPVFGDVEVASWFLKGRILGITGSNGKTTTTALTGHLLRECAVPCQVGGNIGMPLASLVESSRDEHWNVLELSSFQLETIGTFHAQIGVALNVTPDHLDRHGTLERYWAAKARLFENQKPEDFAVLNAEDPATARFAGVTPAQVHWFSAGGQVPRGVWVAGDRLVADGEFIMPVSEVRLRGRHNLENVAAAAAAARLAGASLEGIRRGVATFPGVEHRIEFVRNLNGVEYYNDSKATNVDATLKAIDSFPGGIWIILGGKDKNSDYTVLRNPLKERARAALLIGAAASKIADQLGGVVPLEQCGTLAAAVTFAHSHARPGDTVLLAPACASFDQFDNYEHRGRVFKQLVADLKENSQ
ncbi:MAG: UDP-N-acetylmuramoyl-L-alanine--D-glutamate ligase [Bryobacterales bacterium]|nr:UDP-N-acetylmuramoyl-L-alanine--D-glutamate ligase [Bryobacterales bacterium]